MLFGPTTRVGILAWGVDLEEPEYREFTIDHDEHKKDEDGIREAIMGVIEALEATQAADHVKFSVNGMWLYTLHR